MLLFRLVLGHPTIPEKAYQAMSFSPLRMRHLLLKTWSLTSGHNACVL